MTDDLQSSPAWRMHRAIEAAHPTLKHGATAMHCPICERDAERLRRDDPRHALPLLPVPPVADLAQAPIEFSV